MSTTLKLKRSGTGGAVPSTTAISEGEIFINYYDGKLFFLKNQSGTKSIVTLSAASGGGGASALSDLSDVSLSTPASGDLLKYNGSEWANAATIAATAVTGLSTVATTGAYSDLTGKPSIPSALDDLSDVTISSAASDQILKYNGSAWVNVTTIPSTAVSGLATVATSGSYNDLSNKPSIPSSIDDLSDVTITSATNGDLLKYNGSAFVNAATIGASAVTGLATVATTGAYADLTGKPTVPSTLDNLSDVTITSASSGQIISYNGSAWVNSAAPASNLDGLSDVVITSAAKGHFLVHDGTNFVNARIIEANAAATVPLTLKGAASQSGNLFDVQNSAGTSQFKLNSVGRADFAGGGWNSCPVAITGAMDNNPTFASNGAYIGTNGGYAWVRLIGSNTGILDFGTVNSDQWKYRIAGAATFLIGTCNSTNTSRAYVGQFGGWEAAYPTLLLTAQNAAAKGLVVKAAASATANLFEAQDSSGNVLASVSSAGNLTVNALTVNGTTTTINSTTVTVDDPIFTIGGDTAPSTDDNKDRGIEFRWHNGSAAKVGFFGYDDSAAKFTCFSDATNTAEVFSGTRADAVFNTVESTVTTGTAPLSVASTTAVSNLNADMVDGYHASTFILPAGVMMAYGGAAAPTGWLLCDGSSVSRTTYADLFAAIGISYGSADASSFNLPDLRRRTPRGKGSTDTLGDSDGIAAASRALTHTHSVPAHHHGMGTGADLNITSSGATTTTTDGTHSHTINYRQTPSAFGSGAPAGASATGTLTTWSTTSEGAHSHTVNAHTHASSAFSGRIGLVTGGVDGNASMTSGSSGDNYLITNWIIKT